MECELFVMLVEIWLFVWVLVLLLIVVGSFVIVMSLCYFMVMWGDDNGC